MGFDKNKLPFFQVEEYPDSLSQSVDFYKFAIEMAADEVFLMKHDSQIIYVNDSACKRLGYSNDELVGKYVWEWDPLFPKEAWPGFWKELVSNKHLHFETQHRSKDRVIYPVDIHAYIYSENNETFCLAFVNDLSEIQKYIKELEETQSELLSYQKNLETKVEEQLEQLRKKDMQLLQQAKMASMGEMIGHISHQWRQPLSVISMCANNIKLENELGTLDSKSIDDLTANIEKSTQYLSKTIDTFRDFIKTNQSVENIIVQDGINEILNIVDSSLKNSNIELINQIDSVEPIELKIIVDEFNQVILNILNNSMDVLKDRDIDDPWIKISLIKNIDSFTITIEDNGGGIDKDLIDTIFEPYVTTKHESVGTGLGLYIVYKIIVDKYQGKVFAKNTDTGVKFFIELPFKS